METILVLAFKYILAHISDSCKVVKLSVVIKHNYTITKHGTKRKSTFV